MTLRPCSQSFLMWAFTLKASSHPSAISSQLVLMRIEYKERIRFVKKLTHKETQKERKHPFQYISKKANTTRSCLIASGNFICVRKTDSQTQTLKRHFVQPMQNLLPHKQDIHVFRNVFTQREYCNTRPLSENRVGAVFETSADFAVAHVLL